MGNIYSEEQGQREKKRQKDLFYRSWFRNADAFEILPDIGIDFSLVKYSRLNSSAELENSITHSLNDMQNNIPDYVQNLGSALAAFEKIPTVVGLGALGVSMALEFILGLKKDRESKDNTLDMLCRVFAEEKASGVRDSMEEYMKHLRMRLHQPSQALEETERLEKQLSEQLTRLKNSMLYDNQMSSRSLKHWTNGAAFHVQMLIHAARLKKHHTTEHETHLQHHVASIMSLLETYQFDLEELLKQYKTYKKTTISIDHHYPSHYFVTHVGHCLVHEDKELRKEMRYIPCDKMILINKSEGKGINPIMKMIRYGFSKDENVDYMFDNWSQLKETKSYFSDLKEKINDLVDQNNEFNIQKFLPARGK